MTSLLASQGLIVLVCPLNGFFHLIMLEGKIQSIGRLTLFHIMLLILVKNCTLTKMRASSLWGHSRMCS